MPVPHPPSLKKLHVMVRADLRCVSEEVFGGALGNFGGLPEPQGSAQPHFSSPALRDKLTQRGANAPLAIFSQRDASSRQEEDADVPPPSVGSPWGHLCITFRSCRSRTKCSYVVSGCHESVPRVRNISACLLLCPFL